MTTQGTQKKKEIRVGFEDIFLSFFCNWLHRDEAVGQPEERLTGENLRVYGRALRSRRSTALGRAGKPLIPVLKGQLLAALHDHYVVSQSRLLPKFVWQMMPLHWGLIVRFNT